MPDQGSPSSGDDMVGGIMLDVNRLRKRNLLGKVRVAGTCRFGFDI